MNTSLAEAWQDNYSSELILQVSRMVDLAMFPFQVGPIQTYTWYDIDYNRRILKVVAELLPDYVFEFPINHRELVVDPDRLMARLYEELFKFFRYRPSLPVEDHILLGED